MSSKIFLIVVLLISVSIVVLGQRSDGDCAAGAGAITGCSQFIYSGCENATFIADRSAYSEECVPMSLFWDAPTYNMTILFQSDLKKSYSICLQPAMCTQAYRTLADGREVKIDWNTFNREPTCFETEGSDQPTMKFRFDAGSRWHCYGSFINFFYRV
jgi:hypothetical protein